MSGKPLKGGRQGKAVSTDSNPHHPLPKPDRDDHLVEVHINAVHKEVRPGEYAVTTIKEWGRVPLVDELAIIHDGDINRLPDNGTVKIHHAMKFVSYARVGTSS